MCPLSSNGKKEGRSGKINRTITITSTVIHNQSLQNFQEEMKIIRSSKKIHKAN